MASRVSLVRNQFTGHLLLSGPIAAILARPPSPKVDGPYGCHGSYIVHCSKRRSILSGLGLIDWRSDFSTVGIDFARHILSIRHSTGFDVETRCRIRGIILSADVFHGVSGGWAGGSLVFH